MLARDIMVQDVIMVRPEATIQKAAQLLVEHGISGMPVTEEDGQLVGIVSEGDLIRRTEIGTERRRSWWLDLLTPSETRAEDYVRAHAVRVADVMSRRVITASETASLAEIATLLEKHGIKRVPIVRDGRIVGLVSRANLVRALAATPVQEPLGADDKTIRERIIDRIRALPGGMSWLMTVTVRDGAVDLWGPVDSPQLRQAIRVAAESTPGVKRVTDNLYQLPASAE
ncbi:CBS domain-containing protein [Microvirga massiliensis]|uniref:CBS domain-containing protein n=1 Tax=Microvirga massiliensis TaxID=1033741 RepID=UPI00062B86A2|nr:CBS domain-containing protein [Microvirga massiliensis]